MKQRVRSFFLLLLMLLPRLVGAQGPDFCGTPRPTRQALDTYQRWAKTLRAGRTALGPTVAVPVVFTFVRPASAAGQPLTTQQQDNAFRNLFWLEKFYRAGNLSFFIANLNTLDNDADFNREWYSSYDGSLPQRLTKNAVNVVVVPNIGGGFAGFAYYPGTGQFSNVMVIGRDYFSYQDNLVPHEMGHYFNLIHTHEYGDELVNGSNCGTAGDRVCDTPADPFGKSNASVSGCTYTGTAVDANGQPYNPNTRNLMSYWHTRGCQTDHFTPGQFERAYQGYLYRQSNPGSGNEYYDFSAPANSVTVTDLRARPYLPGAAVEMTFTGQPLAQGQPVLVERALSPDGPWQVRAFTNATLWYDTDVDVAQRNYYRVRYMNSDRYSNVAEYAPRKAQTIAFDPVAAQTYGANPVLLTASSSAGFPVGFRVVSGPGFIFNNNLLQITGAGTVEVEALHDGNAEYAPASVRQKVVVNKASQLLSVQAVSDKTFGDGPFAVIASSDRGLPVFWQVQSGPGQLSGNAVTITGGGTIRLRAFNDGSGNYLPAEAGLNVHVARAGQLLSFGPLADKTFGDAPFLLFASASSGLTVQYAVTGPARVEGNQLFLTGAGRVEVTVRQPGNENYLSAADVTQGFNVAKAAQSLAFEAISEKTYGDAPFDLPARSSSGLPLNFSVSGPARVEGSRLHLTGAGAVTVTATQPGNENFLPATAASQSFAVAKASQAISVETPADRTYLDAPAELPALASSGLPVSYAVSGSARLDGLKVVPTGVGLVTVTATQPGNENFFPAADVTRSFTIAKGNQVITFEEIGAKTYGDPAFLLPVRVNSALSLTFVLTGPIAFDGTRLYLTGTGPASITASQPGDANHHPAAPLTRTFLVRKRPQAIAFPELAHRVYSPTPFALGATVNSGLSVRYAVRGSATLEAPDRLRLTGVGEITVTATQPGDTNHLAAAPVVRTFLVEKAPQTIGLAGTTLPFGGGTAVLPAASSANLPVQYQLVSGPATLAGTTLTFGDYGQVTLTATQPGDDNHLPAPEVTRTFCVNPDKPVVAVDPASAVTLLSSSPFRNQWFRNGDTLRGATASRLTIAQGGDYTVRVSNPVPECRSSQVSDAKTVVITALALPAEWTVTVSPNPASDYLTVRLTAPGLRDAPTCEVLDGLGRTHRVYPMTLAGARYEAVMPVREWTSGTHLVRVVAGGRTGVVKVVVN